MSHAVSPCPDAASAAAQHAGINELIRIAELQARGYARDALGPAVPAARHPVDDQPPRRAATRRGLRGK
jgi:hypothetical protein